MPLGQDPEPELCGIFGRVWPEWMCKIPGSGERVSLNPAPWAGTSLLAQRVWDPKQRPDPQGCFELPTV